MPYILRQLELSIAQCETTQCRTEECILGIVNTMETAVAFYVGSLEETEGQGQGYLMYDLADQMGGFFRTSGPNGDQTTGTSMVNQQVIAEFNTMRFSLLNRNCTPARASLDRIRSLMTVPLVQGILRESYMQAKMPGSVTPSDQTRGAMYAASLVPQLSLCHPNDALIIHDNMKTGRSYPPDFDLVKAALENNYHCLVIQCSDVGGMWQPSTLGGGSYMADAGPCGLPPKHLTAGQIVGIVLGSIFGFLILCCIFLFKCLPKDRKSKRKRKQAQFSANPNATAA